MFSKDGPNLSNPEVTRRPKVTPNKYNANNKKIKVAESITGPDEYKAIKNIILSGNYVSGPNVKLFECMNISVGPAEYNASLIRAFAPLGVIRYACAPGK